MVFEYMMINQEYICLGTNVKLCYNKDKSSSTILCLLVAEWTCAPERKWSIEEEVDSSELIYLFTH